MRDRSPKEHLSPTQHLGRFVRSSSELMMSMKIDVLDDREIQTIGGLNLDVKCDLLRLKPNKRDILLDDDEGDDADVEDSKGEGTPVVEVEDSDDEVIGLEVVEVQD
jgi:hypothetical protein